MASLTAMTSYPQSNKKLEGKKREIKSSVAGGEASTQMSRTQRNRASNYTLSSSNRDYVIMKASAENTVQ